MFEPLRIGKSSLLTTTSELGREQSNRRSREIVWERGKRGRGELSEITGTVQGQLFFQLSVYRSMSLNFLIAHSPICMLYIL